MCVKQKNPHSFCHPIFFRMDTEIGRRGCVLELGSSLFLPSHHKAIAIFTHDTPPYDYLNVDKILKILMRSEANGGSGTFFLRCLFIKKNESLLKIC